MGRRGSGNTYYAHHTESGTTAETRIALRVPRYIPPGRIALTNARILTMDDPPIIERGTLVVEGARIACVGECTTDAADRIIDATGKTVMPGLVDMHSHHYHAHLGIQPRKDFEQAIYLAYGVTTSFDCAVWSQNAFPTADLIDAGLTIGPRTYATGDQIEGGPDDMRRNEIRSYEMARDEVRRLASWGATGLKQYLIPRRNQRQWISDWARKEGLMLTAEGGHLTYNLGMIMDGHTGWEHQLSQTPLYADATKFFGQAGATYVHGRASRHEGRWKKSPDRPASTPRRACPPRYRGCGRSRASPRGSRRRRTGRTHLGRGRSATVFHP